MAQTELEAKVADPNNEQYQEVSFNVNGTPIKFQQKCIISDKQAVKNIVAALKTNVPALGQVPISSGVPLAIVGSGPSLKDTWEALKHWPGEIYALNAAHDFLVDKGVIPTAAVAIEGGTAICKYFEDPHEDVYYLLASSCHPRLFKNLKNHKLAMFHLAMDSTLKAFDKWLNPTKALPDAVQEQRSRFVRESAMISGGSTVLTRTLCLGSLLGHRDFHFFGCDSSFFDADKQHSRDNDRYGPGWGTYIDAHHIDLQIDDVVYKTSPQLLNQVFYLKQMMDSPHSKELGLTFSCYGDSLLQHSM
ncbi:MAG: DUF115 domain-containing protein [Desulfobacteraceae bacterium]|nr:DUF115 domain-containing protein [Desulfobacteraceae bacterium]